MSATLRPGFFFIYSPIDGPIWSGSALLAGPVALLADVIDFLEDTAT